MRGASENVSSVSERRAVGLIQLFLPEQLNQFFEAYF
jgi:hypothetical protein